jgi:hypothetical protein
VVFVVALLCTCSSGANETNVQTGGGVPLQVHHGIQEKPATGPNSCTGNRIWSVIANKCIVAKGTADLLFFYC